MEITLDQLKKIAKNQKEEVLLKFVDPLNKLYAQFEINTNLRVAFYLANVLHECAEFKFLREIGSGSQYEGRIDLQNTQPGFGKKFLGRGAIMCTGFINYKRLSDYFKVDFLSRPELLEEPKWAVLSSGFFWMNTKLNVYCDQNNFLQVCYRINGGFNGLKERLKYLKIAFKALQVPDYDLKIKDVFNSINQNLLQPQTNHFKVSLAKSIPNQAALLDLKKFINLV
jgi:putative chitinase